MNRKMLISIALVFIMILNCFAPLVVIAGDETNASGNVEITLNGALYKAIQRSFVQQGLLAHFNDAQRTMTISSDELSKVTRLDLSNGSIKDLTGLEIFTNLVWLDLSANKLTQDSHLEVLNAFNLNYLDLSSNEIEDLSMVTNFDAITETNLHNQEFKDVQILTLTSKEEGDEADEVISKYTVTLPQILTKAGVLKSEWLVEELYPDPITGETKFKPDWATFDPTTLELTLRTGGEDGPYRGMIKFSIKITDPANNLYNSKIDIFFVAVDGEQRGIIFKDKNLYEAVRDQLTEDQTINDYLTEFTDSRTLYDAAYDEPMVLVININTLINEINTLILDNIQCEDLTGIEKFVGLKDYLDVSYNYVDTLDRIFELIDEKAEEGKILQTKFKKKMDKAGETAKKMKAAYNAIRQANRQIEAKEAQYDANNATINRLRNKNAELTAEVQVIQDQIDSINNLINNLTEENNTLEEDIRNLKQQKLQVETQLAAATDADARARLQALIDDYTAQISAKEAQLADNKTAIEAANTNKEALENDEDYKKKRDEINANNNTINTLQDQNSTLLNFASEEQAITKAEETITTLYPELRERSAAVYTVFSDYYKFTSLVTIDIEQLDADDFEDMDYDTKLKLYKDEVSKLIKIWPNLSNFEKRLISLTFNFNSYAYDDNGNEIEDPGLSQLNDLNKAEEVGLGTITNSLKRIKVANEIALIANYCFAKRVELGVTDPDQCFIQDYLEHNKKRFVNEMFSLDLFNSLLETITSITFGGYDDCHTTEEKYNYFLANNNEIGAAIDMLAAEDNFTCHGPIDMGVYKALESYVNLIVRAKDADQKEIEYYLHLPDLDRLDASYNLIESIEGLEKLSTLIELYLRDNEIVDIECVDWTQFTKLRVLDLGRNEISKIQSLEVLPKIRQLYLDSNLIEGRLDFNVSQFRYLEVLDLSYNKISDIETIMEQYIFIARGAGYDDVGEFFSADDTVKIYFYGQVLRMKAEVNSTDDIVYLDLPPIFSQIEKLNPKPTNFGIISARGNVTNDGKRVMLDLFENGEREAIVTIESAPRYGVSIGEGTNCTITYVVDNPNNYDENTVNNIVPVNNVVANTVNDVNNSVDNGIGNNTVDNNTNNNTVNNTVSNEVDPSRLGYEVQGDEVVGISPDTTILNFRNKLTKDYDVQVKTSDGSKVKDDKKDSVATGDLVILSNDGTVVAVYEAVVKGDVNGDGTADAIDSRLIKAERADKIQLEDLYREAADIDNDGDITAIDSRLLLYHRAEVRGYIL